MDKKVKEVKASMEALFSNVLDEVFNSLSEFTETSEIINKVFTAQEEIVSDGFSLLQEIADYKIEYGEARNRAKSMMDRHRKVRRELEPLIEKLESAKTV